MKPAVKDKYDFILELLESRNLSPSQKERVMKLSANLMKENSTKVEEIMKRVEKIEKEIGPKPEGETTNDQLNKYINPGYLYQFLFEYNQNPVLKYTCHEVDADAIELINQVCNTHEYNFLKHYNVILDTFNILDKNFAPANIKNLIRGYLTGKNYNGENLKRGWSSNNILTNWAEPNLLQWSNQYPNLPPHSITSVLKARGTRGYQLNEVSFNSNFTGRRVQTFRELVLHFKSLFHVKFGPDSLYNIISYINNQKNWVDSLEITIKEENFPKNIELFTDVDKLVQAYKKIIELIVEQHLGDSKPKVNLSFYEKNNKTYLSIHHINNIYNKTIQNTIERLGEKYNSLIKYQINGLCNLYLKADFGNEGYALINIWNGKTRNKISISNNDFIGGIEHIFEFIKNKNDHDLLN